MRGSIPGRFWRTIERERCTVVLGVPTIYKLLMEAPEFKTVDLSHVRWLISGGAPLPLYIIEAYQQRGVVFKQGYGLTEVGVNCFSMTVAESARKKGSIGKPMMFTEARAAKPDGSEAPADEVGELWLRGPHVCKGYWNNPEATAAAMDADGWFHTGDLARRDEEGFYYIAGRQKDMLISGGVNVYPAEIEAELLLHPAVQDAAVVGVPDATWGEIGAGCIVLRKPGSVTGDELADSSARLADTTPEEVAVRGCSCRARPTARSSRARTPGLCAHGLPGQGSRGECADQWTLCRARPTGRWSRGSCVTSHRRLRIPIPQSPGPDPT